MKHYIDIDNLREEDVDLGNGMIRKNNCSGFIPGDIISITEKIDGSNASIRYDIESKQIKCFSRKQELTYGNTLNGFWNHVQLLDANKFADTPNYVIFGEWLIKNKIIYDKANMRKWYVYSIFDDATGNWLNQDIVKEFCKTHDLIYVHELYYGPFISWEHCKTFANSPIYGDTQEGIVIRNISKLNTTEKVPFILKIVNDSFKESMIKTSKEIDPEKEEAKLNAQQLLTAVVTRSRVEKMLLKLRDEGILPDELTPKDMGTVAKNLPKRLYEDILKEESEVLKACGEYGGKTINGLTMKIAKEILKC